MRAHDALASTRIGTLVPWAVLVPYGARSCILVTILVTTILVTTSWLPSPCNRAETQQRSYRRLAIGGSKKVQESSRVGSEVVKSRGCVVEVAERNRGVTEVLEN